jgi:hypothetical protein
MYADNASMIVLAHDFSGNFKRVKHYAVRINFMIEQVHLKVIEMVHKDTADNTADILTKPVKREILGKLKRILHVGPVV